MEYVKKHELDPSKLQQEGNLLLVSVTDTGSGIPYEVQDKLFQKFGTFDHNKGSNKRGIGLGLMITQSLAGKLGPYEKIRLFSQPGRGSRFFFLIRKHAP